MAFPPHRSHRCIHIPMEHGPQHSRLSSHSKTATWAVSHTASNANCLAVIAPSLRLVLRSAAGCRTPSSLITPVAVWQHPAVTHQASTELAPLEQATMMLNDSNAISCTVPVFAGNEAAPFPGIREQKMTGIPGRPGMKTLDRMSNNSRKSGNLSWICKLPGNCLDSVQLLSLTLLTILVFNRCSTFYLLSHL